MPAPSLTRAPSVLTESSTETAFEDELAAFRPPSPIVFADEDIFEPEHQLFEQEREDTVGIVQCKEDFYCNFI